MYFNILLISYILLYRCAVGFEGLQQQGVTNQIVNHFIVKYDEIFLEDGELSPFIQQPAHVNTKYGCICMYTHIATAAHTLLVLQIITALKATVWRRSWHLY